MNREFFHEERTDILAGAAARKVQDPIVVNFDGSAASLSDHPFAFDLNNDGRDESISMPGSGSGFLAFDRNGDGRINSGAELFGPGSGDGFGELAAYDTDHTGWIDEGDAIYGDLRLWSKDAAGNDTLASLKEKGVAALSLTRVATPFDLRDPQNNLLGQVQSTGVYLTERGSAGTVQQLNLLA